MIEFLQKEKISCSYANLNGLSHAIQGVTKTFLEAEAMYFNGRMLAKSGTAVIASVSQERMIPVVAFCETFKFSNKAMLDSIVKEEIEQATEYVNGTMIRRERQVYDITPTKLINMVTCEVQNIPSVSVPVIIREFEKEDIKVTNLS